MNDSLLPTNLVACSEGHGPLFFRDDLDCCPACKEISKRLTEVNALEVKATLLIDVLRFYAEASYYYDEAAQCDDGDKACELFDKFGIAYERNRIR